MTLPFPRDAAPPLRPRWRDTLASAGTAVSSALTHAPENAAYGLMALAPLGAAMGPVAMGLALLGAVVASVTASLAGSGRLVGDAGAALALLTAGLVAALLPRVQAAQSLHAGPADATAAVLLLTALAIVATGVLTAVYGLLRIGALVKFTPYPVRIGLSSGVGLLLIGSAAPAAMGQGFSSGWPFEAPLRWGAVAVGLCAIVVTLAATRQRARGRWAPPVPPVLLGLGMATLLQAALTPTAAGATLGATVGVPALPASWFGGSAALAAVLPLLADPALLALLASFALTASVVVSLDTLLAASIIDGRLRRSRDANRELLAQGCANVASALVGGLPASPAVPASLGLVQARPAQRHIVILYAAALALLLLALPGLLGVLPVSAVGGALVVLGAEMIAPALWQTPRALLRRRSAGDPAPAGRKGLLAANWAVTMAVALSALLLGLGPAVLIGASFAVLLFVRANMHDVVRRVWDGRSRHSLKTRPTAVAEALRQAGRRIVLLELEGPLFFGTADALRARLQALAADADTVILDLHQVGDVDLTAARILLETAEDWAGRGHPLVFAEWGAGDRRRELLLAVAADEAGDGTPALLQFVDTTDLALEQAEERLLATLPVEQHPGQALTLGETMIARGLDADELALLGNAMSTHHFGRGELLFRAGDPADRLYISVQGEIGLRVPDSARRLVSFAPGVTIGEMAVLAGAPRSADAVAESDVTALGISVQAFDELLQRHPVLAAKVSRNIALHLADRVRMLSGDLAAWVSRSGAARAAAGD